MQTVYLNGNIDKFGQRWETDCTNIRDIFKLIECQTPGFRRHLLEAADAGVGYEVKRGDEFLESEQELLLSLNNEDIIITEVPSGSKSGGQKLLAAVVIVALAFVVPGGAQFVAAQGATGTTAATAATITTGITGKIMLTVALNLALSGVSQLLAPGPETDEGTDESYLFDGPTNNITQGLPVPVAYGELVVGGAPISASYATGGAFAGWDGTIDLGNIGPS